MAEAAEYPVPFSQMTLVDWLDDLTVRFLLNLPPAELSSVPRLCFQVEEAQWFYEDFIRPANPQLPSLNLRQFCMTLFQHCPLLSGFDAAQHLAAYEEFLAYKVRVPVRGAILMDDTMEKVLLVRGWKKGASWSFPRGKINKNEKDIDCAIREVYEETGFDLNAAGLVRLNEESGQVKAIDITMREQHMKLFIFRGVPLDTYFEPKTRKEISKIQWYNVRDLPGFKKNKGGPGTGQGEAQASKFYMVAPFLGHLKKWISHQRKRDASGSQVQHHRIVSASHALGAGITEDEGDTEADMPHGHDTNVSALSADGLKRLLSIGPTLSNPVVSTQEAHAYGQSGGQSNLLALLQGGQISNDTQRTTSLDQNFNPGLLHHLDGKIQPGDRHVSMSSQHQQPGHLQASSSPQYLPAQHHHQLHKFQSPAAGLSIPGSAPSQIRDVQSLRSGQQSTVSDLGTYPSASAQNAIFAGPNRVTPASWDQLQQPSHPSPLQPSSANLLAAFSSQQRQGPSATFVSGPRIPEASKLPAPKLNAHSMKLLDAFKTMKDGGSAIDTQGMSNKSQQKVGGQQQAVLLDLFKKTPTTRPTSSTNNTAASNAVPTPSASSEQAPVQLQRKPTANEITRTLPFNSRLNSPMRRDIVAGTGSSEGSHRQSKPQETFPTSTPQPTSHETQDLPRRVVSTKQQLPEDQPKDFSNDDRSLTQPRKVEHEFPAPPLSILQRAGSRQGDGQPKPTAKKSSNSPTTPQFSILQRPGSSTGKGSRQSVPQSPLRRESNLTPFQPQVLKRPTTGLGLGDESAVDLETQPKSPAVAGKTDQLLALFGKTPTATSSPQQGNPAVSDSDQRANPQQRDMLLNLFSTGNAQRNASSAAKTPPPAPQLVPERNPSRPQNGARQQNQQHLLNLISVQNSNTVGSPGTPISPFTLGTPITKLLPGMQQLAENSGEMRSRIGSVASMVSNGTNSGRQTPTPSTVTPTEARGVLLDYLNGVVKEGYRGAKRS